MYAHSQAPVRIGIAGGGTDLPAWTRERRGLCLSLAIKTYVHAVAIARPDRQVVASYRHLDQAACATEIANGLVRESALLHGWEDGFEVHTMSEVSSHGSGLGVSSAIAVALAATFSRMSKLREGDEVESKWFDGGEPAFQQVAARDAWTVEIDRLRRPIGRQDHMAAAHGGLRLYAFEGSEARIERSFSEEDSRWVADHLCLMQLAEGHDSRAILSSVKSIEQLQSAYDAVMIAETAIAGRDIAMLGKALSMGQASKRGIPGAVTSHVGELVEKLQGIPGVFGCKVAGAGGGGHIVVACDLNVVENIRVAAKLSVRRVVPDLRGLRSEGWV